MNSTRQLRIGLTQRVEVLADRGERRDCLDQAWFDLLFALDWLPVPLPNRPALALRMVEELGLDGLIFTGGNDLAQLPGATNCAPERDATERALLELARTRSLPLLGVCRGLQLLVDAFGGRLTRVDGHVRHDHAIVRVAAGFALPERRVVNSFHGWGVRAEDLGPGLRALALADDGTIEALHVVDAAAPIVGWMWHPERGVPDAADLASLRAVFASASGDEEG